MFDDMFKMRYRKIPFAIFERDLNTAPTEKQLTTALHNHREVEILIIRSGEAFFSVNGRRYLAREGELVLISPYYPHSIQFCDDGKFSDACICFDLALLGDGHLQEDLESGRLVVTPIISGESASELRQYVDGALRTFQDQKEGWVLEVTGYMMLLFGKLKAGGYLPTNLSFDREKDFCCKVIRYIEKHFHEPITSKDVAEALFLNNCYFCRTFKKHFSQTFSQYLCFFRLEKSRAMLMTTEKSVAAIGEAAGFQNDSYYIKMFHLTYGETPGEYRRLYREGKLLDIKSF